MRRKTHYIAIDTPEGLKKIHPTQVTGVTKYRFPDSDYVATVYHGLANQYNVYLTQPEVLQVLRLLWNAQGCLYRKRQQCYQVREARSAPQGCIGCQLRQVLRDRPGGIDLREAPEPPEPWINWSQRFKVALAVGIGVMGSMWLMGRVIETAQTQEQSEHHRRVAAEQKLETFLRQQRHQLQRKP